MRERPNRRIVRADTNHYITNPLRLLTGPLGWSEPPPPASMCSTRRALITKRRSTDTPSRIAESSSGLCQHVEGGSCGVRIFRRVLNTMGNLTRLQNVDCMRVETDNRLNKCCTSNPLSKLRVPFICGFRMTALFVDPPPRLVISRKIRDCQCLPWIMVLAEWRRLESWDHKSRPTVVFHP
jgi:hypothetical protein